MGKQKNDETLTIAKNRVIKRTAPPGNFPIVAIGASAGGLEAITELLKYLPSNTGMAFIYVQHLSPDYKSMLAELLAKQTKMKVQEVTNMVRLRPDNFYIVPPDKDMSVVDGKIKLSTRKKEERGVYMPIDAFFMSLAEKHKEGAIGIILSGSASDGAKGLRAIKNEGGLTFAQDNSATFTSMPKSAINEGIVDFILAPREIAQEIARISKTAYVHRDDRGHENQIESNNKELHEIFATLYSSTGVDFTKYKINTIKRRILRRMLLYRLKRVKDYAALLKRKEKEVEILYQELLINVTSFFRENDAYQYLKTTLFPQLLRNKKRGETLRIWVPACSTGEEAYSIAMSLLELQEGKARVVPIQIFASDIGQQAIEKARIGEYSKQEVQTISPHRLRKFFNRSDGGYRITKNVRDLVVFAPHNILSDPPFSRIDLISCCNLLIYLDLPSQKSALKTFHYALNPGGYIRLSKSESIGSLTNLFAQANKKFKIYAKKPGSEKPGEVPFGFATQQRSNRKDHLPALAASNLNAPDIDKAIDEALLTHHVPPSVVITYDMEIVQFRGSTNLYLRHLPGKANLNILKMSRPEIAFELRSTIQKAIKSKHAVHRTGVETKIDNLLHVVDINVSPLNLRGSQPLLLIVFNQKGAPLMVSGHLKGHEKDSTVKEQRIKKLESDLAKAFDNIRSLTEEHEAATEELQSSNEEVVSSNEELRSVNEELQTSQEEIESTNEELITTNQELIARNELLAESYNYVDSIIATIHEPLLILDEQLRVKSANRAFYRKFQVKEDETEGRTLFELGNGQWDIPQLRHLFETVLLKKTPFRDYEITHVFPNIGKRTILINGHRLIQKNRKENLVMVAINDITEPSYAVLKAHNLELEKSVEERTRELREAYGVLRKNNTELENINKELSSFAYISSHDLQEPLRKIQTFCSRLAEKEVSNLSDEGNHYFSRIQEAAGRMQTLIEDLLTYSRTSTANRKMVKTDLNRIVKEVQNELKEIITEKQAVIETAKLHTLRVIPFQFRQLMTNLLSNALKFSIKEKAPHVIVKDEIVKGREVKGAAKSVANYCHISIKDNGIGFEPEYNSRIFEVFQRLHNQREYSGTGIGLAIVKRIVENHNGLITAEGNPGKGATFNIYIPV